MSPKKRNHIVTDEGIGALVRERRQETGFGFSALAEAIGISDQMLQKHETGVSPLTVVRLVKIAEALKCKTTDLIP